MSGEPSLKKNAHHLVSRENVKMGSDSIHCGFPGSSCGPSPISDLDRAISRPFGFSVAQILRLAKRTGRGDFNLLRMTVMEGNEAIMGWLTRFSCLFIFMSLAMALPVNAKSIDVPLSKMVQESELIVIGTVTAYVNTGEVYLFERENFKREFPFYKATIKVEKTLKGNPKNSEIYVYSFGTSSEPEFHVQERGVFFIETDRRKSFKGRQSVTGGYA